MKRREANGMKQFSVSYGALMRKIGDTVPFGLLSQQTSPLGEMLHIQKQFTGDRYRIRNITALNALDLLRRALLQNDEVTMK